MCIIVSIFFKNYRSVYQMCINECTIDMSDQRLRSGVEDVCRFSDRSRKKGEITRNEASGIEFLECMQKRRMVVPRGAPETGQGGEGP